MKAKWNGILKGLALLLAGAALGYFLLVAVYAIPQACLLDKAEEAVGVMAREGTHARVDRLNRASVLDNYTDSLMLNEAFCGAEGSPMLRAVAASYYRVRGLGIPESFQEVYGNGNADFYEFHYIRYWHGYLTFLKPLLCVLSYSGIRWVNAVALAALLALVALLMRRRGLGSAIPPLVATALCSAPLAIVQSLQYSGVTYATLLGMAALLWNRKEARVPYIFLATGMLTNYLDLLTFPTVSLTMPLLLYALLLQAGGGSFTWKRLLGLCFAWGAGYAGMWAMKWCLGVAVYGRDAWAYIFEAIVERSGGTVSGERVGRLFNLLKCFAQLCSNYLGMAAALACAVWYLRRRGPGGLKAALPSRQNLPLVGIAIIPVAWLLVMGNHTALHSWMVYRNLVPLVWVALTLLQTPAEEPRR